MWMTTSPIQLWSAKFRHFDKTVLIQVLTAMTSGARSQIEVHFVRIFVDGEMEIGKIEGFLGFIWTSYIWNGLKFRWTMMCWLGMSKGFVQLCLHLLCDHFQEQRNKIKVDMGTTMVTITGVRISLSFFCFLNFLWISVGLLLENSMGFFLVFMSLLWVCYILMPKLNRKTAKLSFGIISSLSYLFIIIFFIIPKQTID